MPKELGTLKGLGGVWDNMFEQSGRVYDTGDTSPTLHTNGGGNQELKILTSEKKPRIRKLTPKECWRLMGFDDEDFDTAKKALNETHYNGRDRSNSQLYKQAGNSIVVNVLEGVLRNLFLVRQKASDPRLARFSVRRFI